MALFLVSFEGLLALGVGLPVAAVIFMLAIYAVDNGKIRFGVNQIALRVAVSEDVIAEEMRNLSYKCKKTKGRGNGISLKMAKKTLAATLKRLSFAQADGEIFEYERWIFENHHILNQALRELRGIGFEALPHIGARPRIYYVAKTMVELSEARLDEAHIVQYLQAFCIECPLSFFELRAFRAMLVLVLIEYACVLCTAKVERDGSFSQKLVRYNSLISACITSIRQRSELLSDKKMLLISPINSVFLRERAGIYPNMAIQSRIEYAQRCAQIALTRRISEQEVAQELVATCKGDTGIGAILFGEKSSATLQRLYLAALFFMSLGASIWASFLFERGLRAIFILLSFLCFLSAIRQLLNKIVMASCKNRFLPRMDFSKYIPKEHSTLVIVPELIASVQELERAKAHILRIKAANEQKNMAFGLLLDLPSSTQCSLSGCEREICARLEKLARENDISIYLRKRVLDESSGKYCAFERKRGALIHLNQHLLGHKVEWEFVRESALKFKYIITLDCDTFINCATELVETMAHPLNHKYSVVAPKMRTEIKDNASLFALIFEGGAGFDSYSYANSDFSSTVFDCGNYMGKGIYDIERFTQRVGGRFPQSSILSHDFIEGAFSGAVNCELSGLDSFPNSFGAFLTRQLRWTRGDWQLLPYLSQRLKNERGNVFKSELMPYQRFQIAGNLVFSLLPVMCAALIVFSVFSSESFYIALITGGAYIFIPFLYDIAIGLNALAYRQRMRIIIDDRLKSLARMVFSMAVVPIVAISNCAAIIKTIYRLAISKKNLLQWRTSQQTDDDFKGSALRAYLNLFVPQYVFSLALFILAFIFSANFIVYCALALLFLIAPFLAAAVCRQNSKSAKPSESERAKLLKNAEKNWHYFLDCMNYENNYLPADNFSKNKGFAPRTSPTNIGFGLVAAMLAFELNIESFARVREIMLGTLKSIEKLEKYKGNLYNWYNIKTLAPLNPRYVSSVDSGNLLACLLLTKALLCTVDDETELQENAQELIERIDKIVEQTKIQELFDYKSGLLFVGYNQSAGEMDTAKYDLLASESTLTYLVGCALGKLPSKSLKMLSRAHVKYGGNLLYSWTGGVFEYLMCAQFIDFPKRTMIESSNRACVKSHRRYARKQRLGFFGISEGQYNFSIDGDYQYKAFGVPQIAVKSNAENTKNAAPYAAFLALSYSGGIKNALKAMEFSGEYGAIEAVDFNKGQQRIESFMAHHLGMSLLATSNLLLSEPPRKRMSCLPTIAAAVLMLNELVPTERAHKKLAKIVKRESTQAHTRLVPKSGALSVNLLTNGSYHSVTDNKGGGYSMLEGVPLTLFTSTRQGGFKVFLDDKIDIAASSKAMFSGGFTRYNSKIKGLDICVSAAVFPEVNGEIKSIKIKNLTDSSIETMISSKVLPALAPMGELIAHPSFSRMFIESAYDERNRCLVCYRRNKENKLLLAHTILEGGYTSCPLQHQGLNAELCLKKKIRLASGESSSINFVLTAAHKPDELFSQLSRLRGIGYAQSTIDRASNFFKFENALMPEEQAQINSWIKSINYREVLDLGARADSSTKEQIQGLTQLGINMNNPIMTIDFSRYSRQGFERLLELVSKLFDCSSPFNLVILFRESKGYFSPWRDIIMSCIEKARFYSTMPQGSYVFVLNESEIGEGLNESVRALSDILI